MKTEAIFITNYEEVVKAAKLGYAIPEIQEDAYPMLFNIEDVKACYINRSGEIVIYFEVIDDSCQYRMKYTKELWSLLEEKFK
jgi:hypothetical protein